MDSCGLDEQGHITACNILYLIYLCLIIYKLIYILMRICMYMGFNLR